MTGSGSPARVRLVLVRHGTTDRYEQGRFTGWADEPINEAGRAEARGLRATLPDTAWTGVWSSDLSRAVETARLAGFEPTRDPRLRELNFGELEGTAWADADPALRARLRAFERFEAPGGESVDAFRARVTSFLDDLPPGDHLVFTHGGVVRLIAGRDRSVAPASVTTVER